VGVTDCHVHINPLWEMHPEVRALLGRLGEGLEVERYLREPQRFLEYLDRSGVERAVLVNYVAPRIIGYTEASNAFVAEYCHTDPDRLIAVGSVLPDRANPGAEVERLAREAGLRGLKIHPPHQEIVPNGYRDGSTPGLREIYGAAERLGLPVIFHTGTSVFPGARNRGADPLLIEDVAVDFPRLTIVLAHGGRPLWMPAAVFLARRFPRVYLEVSSVPPKRLLEYFPELPRMPEKVLFGSDWPGPGVRDIGENLRAFRVAGLSASDLDRILQTNPETVFPRR
jgi:uncharacterized protein